MSVATIEDQQEAVVTHELALPARLGTSSGSLGRAP